MTGVAALLAAVAAWLALSPGGGALRWEAVPLPPRARGSRWRTPAAGLAVVVGVGAAAVVGGHRGALTAAVAGMVAITAAWILTNRARQRRARSARSAVSQACASVASLLAAGRVPAEALRDVAADWPVLAEGAETVALGGDPAPVWLEASSRPGHGGLAELARGWSVAATTGAPLVALLDSVAAALRSDAEIRHTIEAELASSRATGRLLAALPLVGLALGFGFGGNPVSFLVDQPAGWACSLAGTLLACCGVVWNERLADKAEAW